MLNMLCLTVNDDEWMKEKDGLALTELLNVLLMKWRDGYLFLRVDLWRELHFQ